LPGVLRREVCLIDTPSQCVEVLLFAPDAAKPLMSDAGSMSITSALAFGFDPTFCADGVQTDTAEPVLRFAGPTAVFAVRNMAEHGDD
jgi:hypothetical protein